MKLTFHVTQTKSYARRGMELCSAKAGEKHFSGFLFLGCVTKKETSAIPQDLNV